MTISAEKSANLKGFGMEEELIGRISAITDRPEFAAYSDTIITLAKRTFVNRRILQDPEEWTAVNAKQLYQSILYIVAMSPTANPVVSPTGVKPELADEMTMGQKGLFMKFEDAAVFDAARNAIMGALGIEDIETDQLKQTLITARNAYSFDVAAKANEALAKKQVPCSATQKIAAAAEEFQRSAQVQMQIVLENLEDIYVAEEI